MARLEHWSLVGLDGTKPVAIRGEISGDERFSDGTPITSSRLYHLDPSGLFACTKNHTYELGAISDAFARWMAETGHSLPAYAQALDAAAKGKATPTKPRPPVSASVTEPTLVTCALAQSRGAATALLATPTLVVAG